MEPQLLLEIQYDDHLNTADIQHGDFLNTASIQIGVHLIITDIQSLVPQATLGWSLDSR